MRRHPASSRRNRRSRDVLASIATTTRGAAAKALLEALERRQLLATTLSGDQLVISTGNAADNVSVTLAAPGPKIVVVENGLTKRFDHAAVRGIQISTSGGDDTISLSDSELRINVVGITRTFTLPGAVIVGGGGSDSISGGRGADEIYGDFKTPPRRIPGVTLFNIEGNDTIDGGRGNDLIRGNGGDDLISGGDGNDSLYGDAGNDTLRAGAGPDGADYYSGGTGGEGSHDGDVIDYGDRTAGVHVLIGRAGLSGAPGTEGDTVEADFERVEGGRGHDTLVGSDKNEALLGRDGNDFIDGRGGRDNLLGGEGLDVLYGGAGNDSLNGGSGGNVMEGQDGDDTLYSLPIGADTINGGAGRDSLSYENRTANLVLKLDGFSFSGEPGEKDMLGPDIEVLRGGTGDDLIDGSNIDNDINGWGGSDTIRGFGGDDNLAGSNGNLHLDGGDGNDTLQTGGGNDLINGNAGDDFISTGPGNDLLTGGAGDDTLKPGTGEDLLSGGDGTDTANYDERSENLLLANNGRRESGAAGERDSIAGDVEILRGGAGNDTLIGINRAETLVGLRGNDSLRGNGGDDELLGGDGNDTLDGGLGRDVLRADDLENPTPGPGPLGGFEPNPGNADVLQYSSRTEDLLIRLNGSPVSGAAGERDTVFADFEIVRAGSGNDTIFGTNNADQIFAGPGNDEVRGLGGNDRLDGGDGNDRLIGGDGNDVLNGRAGRDTLYGQNGSDILYANDGAFDYLFGGAGRDRFRADMIDRLAELEQRL